MNNREQFEAWMTDEQWFHGSDFEWDEGRNCYAQFGIHLAYKAWQAASKASEQQLEESRREFRAADATIHNLELKLAAVVAENAGLKSKGREVLNEACKVYEKLNATISSDSGDFIDGQTLHEFQFLLDVETPVTDVYLAEVRDQGRIEGINFAASRIAAAYNNGFIDKPLEDVDDVVRAILSAKGELGNNLPEDGLSGEYAEKSLVEFAAQLRQGAEHE